MHAQRSRAGAFALLLGAFAAAAAAEPVAFAVDAKASHVRIHLGRSGLFKFMGHEHHIEAPLTEGRVDVAEADPALSKVTLRFASAALFVIPGSEPADDIPKVEARMRGEVLETAKHPEISFTSTSVRIVGEAAAPRLKLVVAGTLALKGRNFPVLVPLEVVRHGEGLEAKGEIELNLRDLGIAPPSIAGVVKVQNRFRLEFEIRARAASGEP